MIGGSQLPVTPALGDLTPSSCLCRYYVDSTFTGTCCKHAQTHRHTQTQTKTKINQPHKTFMFNKSMQLFNLTPKYPINPLHGFIQFFFKLWKTYLPYIQRLSPFSLPLCSSLVSLLLRHVTSAFCIHLKPNHFSLPVHLSMMQIPPPPPPSMP